jgi:hypothetical protein
MSFIGIDVRQSPGRSPAHCPTRRSPPSRRCSPAAASSSRCSRRRRTACCWPAARCGAISSSTSASSSAGCGGGRRSPHCRQGESRLAGERRSAAERARRRPGGLADLAGAAARARPPLAQGDRRPRGRRPPRSRQWHAPRQAPGLRRSRAGAGGALHGRARASRRNPVIRAFYERLRGAGKLAKTIEGAHLGHGLLHFVQGDATGRSTASPPDRPTTARRATSDRTTT